MPDRLKPAAQDFLEERRIQGRNPFTSKPSGFEMLRANQAEKNHYMDGDDDYADNDNLEDARWGRTNQNAAGEIAIAPRKGRKLPRWTCELKVGDGSICGHENRGTLFVCEKCKGPKWQGQGGQLQARVSAILDEGSMELNENPRDMAARIRERILSEHGRREDIEHMPCMSLESISEAINIHYTSLKEFVSAEVDEDVVKKWNAIGKIIRNSNFGKAAESFDQAVSSMVAESSAIMGYDMDCNVEEDTWQPDPRLEFLGPILDRIEDKIPTILRRNIKEKKLKPLYKCLDMIGRKEEQLIPLMEQFFSCPVAKQQIRRLAMGSGIMTIVSRILYSLKSTFEGDTDTSEQKHCPLCSNHHGLPLPPWNAHISMAMILAKKRKTDNLLTEALLDVTVKKPKHEKVTRVLRASLYELMEKILNAKSLETAEEHIPRKMRPEARKIFEEYVLTIVFTVPNNQVLRYLICVDAGQQRSLLSQLCLRCMNPAHPFKEMMFYEHGFLPHLPISGFRHRM